MVKRKKKNRLRFRLKEKEGIEQLLKFYDLYQKELQLLRIGELTNELISDTLIHCVLEQPVIEKYSSLIKDDDELVERTAAYYASLTWLSELNPRNLYQAIQYFENQSPTNIYKAEMKLIRSLVYTLKFEAKKHHQNVK